MSKWKKRDAVFLGAALLIAAALLLWFLLGYRKEGGQVEVTVDGAQYGIYDLSGDQRISIEIDGKITNVLVISGGRADMTEADCPDQICVDHVPISHVGETIVCLPNRVVAAVVGEEQPQLDSVVQ